jgi:hypothetical protein
MSRRARSLLLALAATASLAVAGCGNKEHEVREAGTEGIYVTVNELKYQVQISRILNPGEIEDQAYLRGLPEGEDVEPAADEVWFAVFMRVENDADEPHATASEYEIEDTQGDTFRPLEIPFDENVFAYEPQELPPATVYPLLNSAASDNTINGGLLLFKLKAETLGNRPLELKIIDPEGRADAMINLDI